MLTGCPTPGEVDPRAKARLLMRQPLRAAGQGMRMRRRGAGDTRNKL